ncbi:MAG: hypothetical protein JSV50_18300 [Desulfobacteraceae bacterium]|nr:MAG: hypothetical protein JSV50_18300 [Desulfobacteraceae bacterium]
MAGGEVGAVGGVVFVFRVTVGGIPSPIYDFDPNELPRTKLRGIKIGYPLYRSKLRLIRPKEIKKRISKVR